MDLPGGLMSEGRSVAKCLIDVHDSVFRSAVQ